MRNAIFTAIVALVFIWSVFAFCLGAEKPAEMPALQDTAWGDELEGFQFGICPAQEIYNCGEPVVVFVTIKNVSQEMKSFSVSREFPERGWHFLVARKAYFTREAAGPWPEKVPLTLYGRLLAGELDIACEGSHRQVQLQPGECRSFAVELSRLVDLSLPGEYEVGAWAKIGRLAQSSGWVRFQVKARYSPPPELSFHLLRLPESITDETDRRVGLQRLGAHARKWITVLGQLAEQSPTADTRAGAQAELQGVRALLEKP